jgi:hypothetical protein
MVDFYEMSEKSSTLIVAPTTYQMLLDAGWSNKL